MPEFHWQARTMQGSLVRGTRPAPSAVDLAKALGERGLVLTGCRAESAKRSRTRRGVKLKRKERILVTQQLAGALSSGITLVEILGEFSEAYPRKAVRAMFGAILQNVEGGQRLSESMAQFSKAFPTAYVQAVRAAEQSGKLDRVFDELARDLEWQDEIKTKVSSAMVYPVILLVAVAGVATMFLLFLLPRFEPVFQAAGGELPAVTRVLIDTSHVIRSYWWIFLLVLPAAAFAFRFLITLPAGRYWWDRVKLAVPVINSVTRHVLITRFCGSFSTLLAAGVSLPEALSVSAAAADNEPFRLAIDRAKEDVLSGRGLAESLGECGHFTRMDLRMVQVGERSGKLVDAFDSLSRMHGKSARRAVEAAVTLVEPAMVVCMAGLVLGLAMAILLPVYESMDRIGR